MSSGMNMKEAEKIADKMSYREAIMNCLCARCVPYRKATKIKMERLLECIEAFNLDLDLDTPMHFTPEQKAWVKKYIAINGERQRTDGAREFAEWLPQHFDLRFSNNPDVWLDEFFNHTSDKVLAEWQKGKENENE